MKAHAIADLRQQARRRLPRAIFDFFDGGAEDERALTGNAAAFRRHALIPRVLRDVSQVDLSTTLLGATSALPVAVGPTGAVGLGWRGGDVAIARAAGDAGIPYALSTSATASIEEIAQASPEGRKWFQAYIFRQREVTDALVQRAYDAGYEALMITVDLPVGGKRERDARNDFSIPFRYTPRNLLDFATRPAWALPMLFKGVPAMPNLAGLAPQNARTQALASSVGRSYDPSFNWEDLKRLRDRWPHKLILKGVVHPDDARLAVEAGCDAIVVSNHGGRQLDAGCATLDALPHVVAAVGGQAEVWMDGGIRRGSDIVVALALGARAVLIGRATLYGACAAGQPGAAQALAILHSELQRTMQLCGLTRLSDITSAVLGPAPAGSSQEYHP